MKLRNSALLGASLLASLAGGEVVLRFVNPSSRQPFQVRQARESERGKFCAYDPDLGWAGKPGADDTFRYLDCEHHVHQNEYGFRGAGHPLDRTGVRRLVVLGDSFVWGFGVEDGEIFTSVLEKRSDPPVEVVNLGVSGYGTDQELLLWRSLGARFRPDEVLLWVCPYTDLWENMAPVAYDHPKPVFLFSPQGYRIGNHPVPRSAPEQWSPSQADSPAAAAEVEARPVLARLATRSALVSSTILALARSGGARKRLERAGILPLRDHERSWESLPYLDPPTPESAATWNTLFRLLDLFRRDVEGSGARFEVGIVPSVIQVYPDLWERFVEANAAPPGTRWNRDAPSERIAVWCRANGVRVVDPLPAFRQAAKSDLFLYYGWNSHWTASGHRLVAFDLIRERIGVGSSAGRGKP